MDVVVEVDGIRHYHIVSPSMQPSLPSSPLQYFNYLLSLTTATTDIASTEHLQAAPSSHPSTTTHHSKPQQP